MSTSDFHAKQSIILLDEFSAHDIEQWRVKQASLFDFQWEGYSYYANERSKLADKIQKSLIKGAINFEFDKWSRVLTQKYNNNPLSAAGSRLHSIGGRFNFGQIDPTKYPPFSCLYIASDHDTAMAEKFSSNASDKSGIRREEFAGSLVSYSLTRLSGKLDLVLDVTDKKALSPFINVIKKIPVPDELKKKAKKLKLPEPQNVRTWTQLKNVLRNHDWAAQPSLLTIPSSSQIFGHIVYNAGIQAILYRSKHTGKLCLGVFPENFEDKSGYLKLADPAPKGVQTELSKKTWREMY